MSWLKIVERRGQSVLISSYFYNGIQTKYFKKSLGFNYGLNKYLIMDYSNYYDKEESDKFKSELGKILSKPNFRFLKRFFDVFYKKSEKLIDFGEKIKKSSKENLQNKMLPLFTKFSELCLEFGPSMYLPILAEEIVEKEIRGIIAKYIKDEGSKYFDLFTSSSKPTEGTKELISLYKITAKLKEQKNASEIRKDVQSHLKEFGWLSYTKFVGEPWTEKLILKRAQDLKEKDILYETKELRDKYKKDIKQTRMVIRKYEIPAKEADIIWLAKELSYFRTYRIDIYTKTGFNAKPLFELISKKLGITTENLVFLTYEEIIDFTKKAKPTKEIKEIIDKRRNSKWQLKFIKGRMRFKYSDFDIKEENIGEKTEIKGSTAFPGIMRGNAKIIRGVLEFKKMTEGDILITSMTTPDFVPLMEKARAIVTDEGGITCHAAIVAREMKKPCIIGTKIATKVLKDGDFVEVDADKGTVKILKRK